MAPSCFFKPANWTFSFTPFDILPPQTTATFSAANLTKWAVPRGGVGARRRAVPRGDYLGGVVKKLWVLDTSTTTTTTAILRLATPSYGSGGHTDTAPPPPSEVTAGQCSISGHLPRSVVVSIVQCQRAQCQAL